MTLSEKLIRLRKREGISQEELAQYLNVSRQAVSRWEQGTAMPDAGNLLKLKQRFCVSVDWMLEDEQTWEALTAPEPPNFPGQAEISTADRPTIRRNVLPWAIPLGISGLGLLILGIFASLHPGTYQTSVALPFGIGGSHGRVYTGLLGSLKCYHLEWLFWLCAVIAAGSLAAGLWQQHLYLKALKKQTGNKAGPEEQK